MLIKTKRILMDATPAKWKVLSVICVPGSPILWAQTAPTAVPKITISTNEYLQCKKIKFELINF